MVISGKFKQSLGSVAGRLGSAAGEGLSSGFTSAFPKELERARLAKGLNEFEKESEGLSPLQQYTRLAAIPGITPQMIQALPEVLKQQQLGKALGQSPEPPPFPNLPEETNGPGSIGLTTKDAQEALRQGFQRKKPGQIDARAAELYNANPARFKNNPEAAIQYAQQEAATEEAAYQDLLKRREGEQNLQGKIENNLINQSKLLGVQVPGDVFSDIRERAVRSVLPVKEGGEGLTDEEAKIKYGNELDEASRQYEALNSIGSVTWAALTPNQMISNLKSVREQFKKRKDLRNFSDKLISTQGLSPSKAYYLTYPVSEVPELNKTLSKIPDVKPKIDKGSFIAKESDYNPNAILNQIMPKLADNLGKEGSPLSVAEELQSKGYNPDVWLDYLNKNRDKYELTSRQLDELNKPRSWFPNLSDIWLFKLSNQDKFVE